jgi:hypothetical protein
MSGVVSIRVSDELRGEMDRFRDRICWNDEIRDYIAKRLELERRTEVFDRITAEIAKRPGVPAGFAARMVREDRDGH